MDKAQPDISLDDEAVLYKMFDSFYHALCFFAARYITDDNQVKDIVQDVFVSAWEKKLSFPNEVALKSFLYTSVYHASINQLKLEKIHQKHHQKIQEETPETTCDYFTDRVEDEVFMTLYTAIEELPTECQKIFKLSYLDGLSIEQVAEKLKISEHTVKSQRARAKKLLQEKLKTSPQMALLFHYICIIQEQKH